MFGSVAGPVTVTVTVTSVLSVEPEKSRIGSRSPANVMMPRSKVTRCVKRSSRPRRIWKAPSATMAETGPVTRRRPPNSASNPRPRTKICRGASMVTSSRHGLASAAAVAASGSVAREIDRAPDVGRRIDVLHVHRHRIARQPLRHGDLGAVEVDRAAQQRPGRELAGQRHVGVEAGGDQRAVDIARLPHLRPEVERKAGAGASPIEPLAVAVPSPLRAVSRSMTSRLLAIEAASERSRSTMPVSGSMKPPPSEVTRPANCGAVAGPVIAMSTLSAPRSTAPREASRGLPSDERHAALHA